MATSTGKVRRFARRTFLDGEGEFRRAGSAALLFVLLIVILILELVSQAPSALYLAFVAVLGYAAGERRRSGMTSEVESVAPPYIPGDEE